ncbi:hypothetical protein G3578_07900 [Brevibacillus sp. SYP-B805]|uniref:VC0807 family protein n=1 Tax=Brevibacillus sp. SYP-B805 TaxID=1578199 RepID=UPI0013EA38B2|nr:VC0807 family protein [Brevibacillus sp. SYP-B805]NGQ95089.1 hypothetical protein [Brevibacillus sp. SYP-B805]
MNSIPRVIDRKTIIRSILVTLMINGALPLAVYHLLLEHMTGIAALSVATCIPLIDNLYHLLKNRRLDVFASFMLAGFLFSLGAVALGGNERFILLRESYVTALLGLIFLGSLFFRRPLIYYFALRFTVGNHPKNVSQFESNWQYPYFRFVVRLMTFVWGIALVGEAVLRSILVFQLSVSEFLVVSNFVTYGFIGAAIVWTVAYRRHSRKRLEQIKQQ